MKSVVGSGATRAVAQGIRLVGTTGQVVIGKSAGKQLGVAAGFWHNVTLDARTGGGVTVVSSDRLERSFTVSPHPVSAISTISFSNEGGGDISIDVLNNEGKLVKTIEHRAQGATEVSMAFDSEDLPSGSYILRIASMRGDVFKRVVVVH
jgi:flagellar hook assembly protein FlgD